MLICPKQKKEVLKGREVPSFGVPSGEKKWLARRGLRENLSHDGRREG